MSDAKPRRKVTFKTLQKKMAAGEPITQLAAYDYRTAVIADRLGMDILCVSDTGGMILFGHQSTTAVSFDEVMMMSKAIDRGSQYGLRMVWLLLRARSKTSWPGMREARLILKFNQPVSKRELA